MNVFCYFSLCVRWEAYTESPLNNHTIHRSVLLWKNCSAKVHRKQKWNYPKGISVFQDNFLAEFQILKVSQLLNKEWWENACNFNFHWDHAWCETIMLLDIFLKTKIMLQCLWRMLWGTKYWNKNPFIPDWLPVMLFFFFLKLLKLDRVYAKLYYPAHLSLTWFNWCIY